MAMKGLKLKMQVGGFAILYLTRHFIQEGTL